MGERMTVDRAVARIMELVRFHPADDYMRSELRKILVDVRYEGYKDGGDDQRYWGGND